MPLKNVPYFKGMMRNPDERRRTAAEQARRRRVDADHGERHSGNVNRLVDRVAAAEQLVFQLAVDDRHRTARQILESREGASRIDVAAVHLHPLRREPRYFNRLAPHVAEPHRGGALVATGDVAYRGPTPAPVRPPRRDPRYFTRLAPHVAEPNRGGALGATGDVAYRGQQRDSVRLDSG